MKESAEELARVALQSALTKLETGADPSNGSSPVVVVVIGSPANPGVSTSPTPEPQREPTADGHPGLERFLLSEGPAPSRGTKKTCFMEPDKICVNSGACEMRGY